MPILLDDAIAEMKQWTVGPPKQKNGQMSISAITGKDGWPSLQLVQRERLGDIYVPFEPSVFRGTGAEPRKGIMFAVPQDVYDNIQKIEEWAKNQISSLTSTWHSCLKEPGCYSAGLKAKINVSGPNACLIFNANGEATAWPEDWARLPVVPIVEVRGIYSQKTGSGLILEVTQLMVGEGERETKQCEWL